MLSLSLVDTLTMPGFVLVFLKGTYQYVYFVSTL